MVDGTTMSGSTSGPSKRRKAPPNPYSQADQYKSLSLFLAAHNLPVLDILNHPAQVKGRSLHSNKWQKNVPVDHENDLDVCSRLLVPSDY